ncbi:MAG: hypothetical protein CVU89_04965 [Firmicutes bacterium HGW-Firmicutes-14]|nr:MAG: hypothetical protein CVU89_04965 [Firmicutes bacterium HGW-Firmicutes-14]
MKVKHLNNNVDFLADNYEKQVALYTEMLKQAEVMIEAIKEGSEEKMKGTFARRQELMKEIDRINSDSKAVIDDVCETLHFKEFKVSKLVKVVHTPGSERLFAAIGKLSEILPEIQKIDTEMERTAYEQIIKLKADMKLIRNSKNVRNAYYQAEQPTGPELLDKKK